MRNRSILYLLMILTLILQIGNIIQLSLVSAQVTDDFEIIWAVKSADNTKHFWADIGDIDGDGYLDLSVNPYHWPDGPSTVQAIKHDGSKLWSNLVEVALGDPNIAIKDVDLDGYSEVFVFGHTKDGGLPVIYSVDSDGSILWNFSDTYNAPWSEIRCAAFLNLDSDDELEIFCGGFGWGDFANYALDTNGTELWRFITSQYGSDVAIGDVNGDGQFEIVLFTYREIYILSKDGLLLNTITPHSGNVYSLGAIGDVTGDGVDDIVVSCGSYDSSSFINTLSVYEYDGTLHWRKNYPTNINGRPYNPLLIDIDEDGDKDVIVYANLKVIAYRNDGILLWSYGDFTSSMRMITNFDLYKGDNRDEILFQHEQLLYVLSLDGDLIHTFDIPNQGRWVGSAHIREDPNAENRFYEFGDINNDGTIDFVFDELVDGQHYITIRTPAHVEVELPENEWPKFRHDLTQTGVVNSTDVKNETLWTYTIGSQILSSPSVINGHVFVGSDNGKMYSLNASTGSFEWSYTTGSRVLSSPAVVADRIYFGSQDYKVHCVDAKTGNQLWYKTTGWYVDSSPTVNYGRVYIGSSDGYVYCLSILDGFEECKYYTGDIVDSSAAVENGRIFIGSWTGSLYCLDAFDGHKIWSYQTEDLVRGSPSVVNGKVFFGSWDNNVYCLDADTGDLIWYFGTDGRVDSSPAVFDDRVYIGSYDCNFYCLNSSTGNLQWNYTTNDIVRESPAIANGKVYFGSNDGNLYCLDAYTGYKYWNYPIGNIGFSSPSIVGGRLTIGTRDGRIITFQALPSDTIPPPGTVTVWLVDSDNNGIQGGEVSYAEGTWKTFGTTGPDGSVTKVFPEDTGNLKVRMKYAGKSVTLTQNIQDNPVFMFQTVNVTVKLLDSLNDGLDGGVVQYASGTWLSFGTTVDGKACKELLPGSYKFRMKYNHTSQQITQDTADPVIFQTGRVVSSGCAIKASLGGTWVMYDGPMELLPGTYKFIFDPEAPGGTTQWITVVAGSVTNID